jgi:hypothetical protein
MWEQACGRMMAPERSTPHEEPKMSWNTTFELAEIRRNETLAQAAKARLVRSSRKARKAAASASAATTVAHAPVARIDTLPVPVRHSTAA